MGLLPEFAVTVISFMEALFIFVIGVGVVVLAALYVIDISQTRHAIRRNYPVIGRLRYLMDHLGTFFRQYFFAMDREEMPFNREQRSWVYRACKDLDNTIAFGTNLDLRRPGTIAFANAAFPPLDDAARSAPPLIIGPDCAQPYEARSIFNISAMSYGAISKPAIQALSKGAAMAGCWLNTGEGGLSHWHLAGGADIVFQMGTALYGVRDAEGRLDEDRLRAIAAHEQVKMIEIKLSQGAKPGKGGILPGAKVTAEIAEIRGIEAGKDSISPNRHPEIDSTGKLLDFIERVRGVTGKPTGIKFVAGDPAWISELLDEIAKRGPDAAPDFITLDSADGGTGAAPMSLADHVGMLMDESLPLLIDGLVARGLRDRIRVIVSGKVILPDRVAWALCMGADFVNSARGFMFALGCIQAMQCNRNTCPTGITTHNPRLQRGLDPADKAERVRWYVRNLVHEVEIIAHSCGVSDPRQLRRRHCRIILESGRSAGMDELFSVTGSV